MNKLLWVLQGVLAALFLFAGVTKLIMPADQLTAQSTMSVGFLRFIGVAETLGALGLVLPMALRIRPGLTALAAAGLVVIMVGATVTTAAAGQPAMALVPLLVGLLAAVVAWGRSPWSSARRPAHGPSPQPGA
jgi:hypothetical protein